MVATEHTGDALVRVVVRANQNGYPILVLTGQTASRVPIAFLRDLGAQIIDPGTLEPPVVSLDEVLARAARDAGYSGLILHRDLEKYIDYNRSVSALNATDSYCANAIPQSPTNSSSTAVAIPAHNEEGTIEGIVRQAQEYVDEVFIVNDGSTDETGRRAAQAGAIVFEHDRNRGYGESLKTIFRVAYQRSIDQLVVLDGDGQHNPNDIPKLLTVHRNSEADIVIGSRFAGSGESNLPRYRAVGLQVVNFLTNVSMGVVRRDAQIRDTQSGFRVYSAEVLRTLSLDGSIGSGMAASTDILYHAQTHGYRIEEVGTHIRYDVDNGSNHNPFLHGFVLVRNILKTIECQYPLVVFGIPGFVSLFVGFGFSYWTITNFIQSGTFPVGLALVTSVLLLLGVFACFTGIILNALRIYHERAL
ncbi:glycosyltransferase family 2 protein [Halovalidus salilacus]|uniref:glycosyltransferase family 2 protein n=1 Tax=Halovalidus salilacus TaxID=3075124 RepID=UPI0036077C12